ncbi:hypothetical protein EK21DRAFT_111551 [Setomelanomma holmii]|uniref:Uncharacterized protein n=1 Tax=Setomelanomma holmii TaxID=210430 RepID=A0A9P4LPI4_9PLEO|nr:hypothetical protein EK21DRAFT_111551 [Setomelanomma holmii]
MEVYYMNNYNTTVERAKIDSNPHPLWAPHEMCRDAEIALYVYFPPHELKTWMIGGVPWKLKGERGGNQQRLQEAYRKAIGPFRVKEPVYDPIEMDWHADGDAIMSEEDSTWTEWCDLWM